MLIFNKISGQDFGNARRFFITVRLFRNFIVINTQVRQTVIML
ncbi:hypothetical protein BC670_2204 [Flavobacterium branchiophilum]|uniref:Uncharacterized protein n=1 Tax=Flavobacterium branchiophilum TaxID=55197 RepID=A0A543G5A4_9FLAO|nr:hypothetical protein BC670_2204 [Flavobacterium branchiophilum]